MFGDKLPTLPADSLGTTKLSKGHVGSYETS